MNTIQYLDALKAATGITSDYGLAKSLGVTRQAVSNWRNGRECPAPLQCFAIAEAIKIAPSIVIADMERERAERRGQADQAGAWKAWLDKLGAVSASFAAAVILSAGFTPTNANADNTLRSDTSTEHRDDRRGFFVCVGVCVCVCVWR